MADRRLQVFAAVARLRSFTRAAEALHMTQPAVTFQIRRLEAHFNARLFDRAGGRIALTEAGELVRAHADRIMAQYGAMEREMRAFTDDSQGGPLSIGASTTIGEYFLPQLLGAYRARFPEVTLRLAVANTGGILRSVEGDDIDVGIVEGPVDNKRLDTEVIWDDELVLICPPDHALSRARSVAITRLMAHPFISREAGSGTREVMENYIAEQVAAQRVGADGLDIIMEFSSPESIKSAVSAGLGISILSIATVEKELRLQSLCAVPLDPPLHRPFSLVRQARQFHPRAADAFVEFARARCRALTGAA